MGSFGSEYAASQIDWYLDDFDDEALRLVAAGNEIAPAPADNEIRVSSR
ncbi:hypothetical protein J7E29_02440 [Streptomyces sp. ISL-90]|nr:hypothetical protein [Streptomyces sp. ISL-90]